MVWDVVGWDGMGGTERTHIALREMQIPNREIRPLHKNGEIAPRAARQVLDLYTAHHTIHSSTHDDRQLMYARGGRYVSSTGRGRAREDVNGDGDGDGDQKVEKIQESVQRTSQFPPCSLPGTVLAPSAFTFSNTSSERPSWPTYAPVASGGNATAGTGSICVYVTARCHTNRGHI